MELNVSFQIHFMIKGETRASVWATKFQTAVMWVVTKEGGTGFSMTHNGYEFKDKDGNFVKIKFIVK